LCAEHNIQVIMPSTAAQMFHVLRRQMLRPYRKPLVIMLSKRLLRLKDSLSELSDLTDNGFKPVISEAAADIDAKQVKRVLLCAGQVYYDLVKARTEAANSELAILRLEQLYPFPTEQLAAELAQYPNATEIMWAQEEPKNQGAWYQIRHRLENLLSTKQTLLFAGRPSSASPAVGYMSKHTAQLKALLSDAVTFAK
jgi:2-oxoglutarate dehydrogenase E1 component